MVIHLLDFRQEIHAVHAVVSIHLLETPLSEVNFAPICSILQVVA